MFRLNGNAEALQEGCRQQTTGTDDHRVIGQSLLPTLAVHQHRVRFDAQHIGLQQRPQSAAGRGLLHALAVRSFPSGE